MSKNILVPLDGSDFSERALPVAQWLAARMSARLHLVHVHTPVLAWPVAEGSAAVDPRWELGLRGQEEQYLGGLADRCAEEAGVSATAELLDGPVVDTLAEYARDVGVDLVVMTTHGRSGLSRAWLGSVADGLIRRSPAPLLLLRPEGEQAPDPERMLRHVLIPLDGSELSESVIEPALELGGIRDARYTLLHVLAPALAGGHPYAPASLRADAAELEERRSSAETYLGRVAERLRERGHEVETATVVDARPAPALTNFAGAHDVDTIAMSTRGRGGWSRVALGSVSDKVIRSTHLPVLVQPPGGVGAGEEGASEG